MFFHHDTRPYEMAAGETRQNALDKLNGMIERGQASGEAVLDQVERKIYDALPTGGELRFAPDTTGVSVSLNDVIEQTTLSTHRHALRQMTERAGVPFPYANKLLSEQNNASFGKELLSDILNKHYHENPHLVDKRFLVRRVDNEVKGFLSDQYKRLNSLQLVNAFMEAIQPSGARIYQGYALDTKVALKAILPVIFEPIPGEPVGFGLDWQTSDFGGAAHYLRFFTWRAWCTNLAIMNDEIREVHFGGRLDSSINYSQETIDSDTKTSVLALRDTVATVLQNDRIAEICEVIKNANNDSIKIRDEIKKLRSSLRKGEQEQVLETYYTAGTEILPAGQTKWRLSNAISHVANVTEDKNRARELMRLAGAVIQKPGKNEASLLDLEAA